MTFDQLCQVTNLVRCHKTIEVREVIAQGFEMSIDSALRDAITNATEGGKSLNQIANEAKVDYGALYRYVSEVRPDIRLSTIEKLCAYFSLALKPEDPPKKSAPPKSRKK